MNARANLLAGRRRLADWDELRDETVKASLSLEQFARLERNRTEPGFFPILLDSQRRLKPRTEPPVGDGSRQQAAALGEIMIAGALVSPSARNQANSMLTQVVMAGDGGTPWPEDLFNPTKAKSNQLRDIALPDAIAARSASPFATRA